MGRIFEKRKERMFARWAKMSKAFTKVGKEIAIAVKLGGADPNSNPRLRMAIQTARSLNMPKDKVEGAIKRASSKDEASLAEIIYEGYGPHRVALMIVTATNNPTRTVANVRSILTHAGGNMGTTGSLSYVFDRRGVFTVGIPSSMSESDLEQFELDMIDHGLEDIFESDDGLLLYSAFEDFGTLQKALEGYRVGTNPIEVRSAGLHFFPKTTVELSPDQEKEINELIEELEEDDDIQHVYHSMKVE